MLSKTIYELQPQTICSMKLTDLTGPLFVCILISDLKKTLMQTLNRGHPDKWMKRIAIANYRQCYFESFEACNNDIKKYISIVSYLALIKTKLLKSSNIL